MNFTRASGILLHPTSLPGTPGIGTLGNEAYSFIDWLSLAGQTLWQVLPLGPTGYGDSPYASFSTFAGNPLLIDLESLKNKGFLSDSDIQPPDYITSTGPVDFGSVVWWKIPLLKKAATEFLQQSLPIEYAKFLDEQKTWLDDFCLFMTIKEFYDDKARAQGLSGKMWNNFWPKDLALRDKRALNEWKAKHSDEINIYQIIQFFFFSQWKALKDYANAKNIRLIGDIPIFVAPDSADVWANQKLFQLNGDGSPRTVAGVPPDYFSETGQLWGNPLYDWAAMRKDDYKWWKERLLSALKLVDYIRIDHFRGFEAYWSIPAKEKTAINGSWEKGPNHDFFKSIKKSLGELPLIAEDLGVITDEVRALRDDFAFPGMKVLQFAFSPDEIRENGYINSFLPHLYTQHCVVYTGTHDNDTTRGWLESRSKEELEVITGYLGITTYDTNMITQRLIREAMMSVAVFAITPLQDIIGLGKEGRMNTPSTTGNNWKWRMDKTQLDEPTAHRLRALSILAARVQLKKDI